MRTAENPLIGAPPADVPLAHPPLIRVIAQVRFPPLLSLASQDSIAPFQTRLLERYPILRPEVTYNVVLDERAPVESKQIKYWRFLDKDNNWAVTLGTDFISIETTRYTNRKDFLERFHDVLATCQELYSPAAVDRLGIRYINRITDPLLQDLPTLVRPEVLGIAATPLVHHAEHAMTQNVFQFDDGFLGARWGILPPQRSVDPAAIDPIDRRSWVLDLDAYSTQIPTFEAQEAVAKAQRFTERIYAFFRWTVTDEFLRRHGGAV